MPAPDALRDAFLAARAGGDPRASGQYDPQLACDDRDDLLPPRPAE